MIPRVLLLGDARQVHLSRWASYLGASGFDVLSVSLEPTAGMPGRCTRISVPEWLPDAVRYPLAVPKIRRIITAFKPHVVNAHFLPNYGVIGALCGFRPWVLSTWGSDIMLLPDRSAFHRRRTGFVLARASYVTSDARVMSERIADFGVDRSRILTFPYGVDRRVFHPVERESDRTGPRILSNRKLEAVYNIEAIIAAFPRVMAALPDAVLTIAGSGSFENRIHAAAGASGVEEAVRFVGARPHDTLPVLLNAHDVFVSVALSDTTSVSLLEAMACGLFPVVSDIPANREWITDGANGTVVPANDPGRIADAIIDAWRRPDLRERARRENQAIIQSRADWHDNMSDIRELFERLATTAGHGVT